jgi:hypothetical protein
VILSVSRRTDIPRFYSDWFFERIKEGFLYVRNPMNSRQISRIDLSPEQVELIVFWTKDPKPMLPHLLELKKVPCYIQFTLTGYGRDVEPGLPNKQDLIHTFIDFSKVLGPDRMVWRYDPIFINNRYEEEYHLRAFGQIGEQLKGHTKKVVISFLDWYGKTARNMKGVEAEEMTQERMLRISKAMAEIAGSCGMRIEACAEAIDLSQSGVQHGSCIDPVMVENILGASIKQKKDKNQRLECGCLESVEVGAYDTCLMGCKYCYANDSQISVERKTAHYDIHSPLLCGKVEEGDKITDRKVGRIKKV